MSQKKILLVDGNSVAFRAFYALYNVMDNFKNADGLYTNAIFTFKNMFEKILLQEQPTHALVAFDAGKTTFRTEIFKDYKAGRAKMPSEFREQMPFIRQLIHGFGVKEYELPNYEADDIIGTLATKASHEGFDVIVVSGDRDLTQLASDKITVYITVKGMTELEICTPAFIAEKYDGLTPKQIIDLKGLAGDKSDNLPGVTKVGEKTAIKLLKQYESIEGIYEHIDEFKPSKMKENLINDKEQAFMSKQLATINVQAPVEITLADLAYQGMNENELIELYRKLNFQSFLDKMNVVMDDHEMEEITYEYIQEWPNDLPEAEKLVLYVEMLGENYHLEDIVGFAFGTSEKIYVSDNLDILSSPEFIDYVQKAEQLITFDMKCQKIALSRFGAKNVSFTFDTLLAAYLLDTTDNSSDISSVAHNYGLTEILSDEQVYGKGAKKGLPTHPDEFYEHLARKIDTLHRLVPILTKELENKNQWQLFTDMEMPLADVLAKMEMTGISVDPLRLQQMKQDFAVRLAEIEQKIYDYAGKEFNINSPKQLGVILFEELSLPVIKKTKTGYSTAVDVLEQLKSAHPIIEQILSYRQLAKLQSTYIEGLLKVIQLDGKIHTRYIQTLTQTGRLSSVDPNLQNIPIRLEEGRKIRQAFVPSHEDWVMYSSDYSQIELRVLAHISDDEHLKEAFIHGQDIHTSTAMRVFGIDDPSKVTSNMRRDAKAVNFGIVYGISDFGLSQNLGISRQAAKKYIDTYFERYPNVKKYMQDIVAKAKEDGYVETLYHRRRYLPDIHAKNFNVRSFAERTAINSPIQGTAADILKMAMIELDKRLQASNIQTNMLLQVHDELVFEVKRDQVEQLDALVKEVMEHVVDLHVPLITDSSWGDTWYDAK